MRALFDWATTYVGMFLLGVVMIVETIAQKFRSFIASFRRSV